MLHPAHPQVLIGGGQDAADVTTTADRAGGFQSRFFHKVSSYIISAHPLHEQPLRPCCCCHFILACLPYFCSWNFGSRYACWCTSQGSLISCGGLQIFMEEIGSVRGHFGPVNAIAIHPDGRSFSTGGEDGYVRINPMQEEKDYLAASTA